MPASQIANAEINFGKTKSRFLEDEGAAASSSGQFNDQRESSGQYEKLGDLTQRTDTSRSAGSSGPADDILSMDPFH